MYIHKSTHFDKYLSMTKRVYTFAYRWDFEKSKTLRPKIWRNTLLVKTRKATKQTECKYLLRDVCVDAIAKVSSESVSKN